jgi:gliding motility-associated-like protein
MPLSPTLAKPTFFQDSVDIPDPYCAAVKADYNAYYPSTGQAVTAEPPVTVDLENLTNPIERVKTTVWYVRRLKPNTDSTAWDTTFSNLLSPSRGLTLYKAGTYKIKLNMVYKSHRFLSCKDSTEQTIIVPENVYYYPNVLTVNGDGKNDKLEFKTPYNDFSLSIFNRYGVPIQKYDLYKNDFTGENLAAGTYFYILKPLNATGKVEAKKGWFELIK